MTGLRKISAPQEARMERIDPKFYFYIKDACNFPQQMQNLFRNGYIKRFFEPESREVLYDAVV